MLHEETGVALRYIQVSAGAYHTVAIDEHENIRTFGSGRRGRLGHPAIGAEEEGRNNGSEESSSNSGGGGGGGGGGSSGLNSGNSRRMYYNMSRPQLVLAMKDLGCGGILLQSNDSQWAFLRHSLSQKEEGNNEGGEEGVAMKFGSNLGAMAKAVQMVACGRSHTLALTRGGAIWAWGDNEQGQCGTALAGGDKVQKYSFHDVFYDVAAYVSRCVEVLFVGTVFTVSNANTIPLFLRSLLVWEGRWCAPERDREKKETDP